MLWLLLALCADARTLAVLPLDKGAGSEAYDGLGLALSGMITADLVRVEGLELVERQKLDAVLAELRLAETGFVDPASAQKLGRGVGAELVVTGSYSVVGETFVLDARVVEVESGRLLDAVSATGKTADFVTVEKDLVEGMLGRIEITLSSSTRRKLLSEAPTESFPAFSTYGEGLAHEQAGRAEQAAKAYESALQQDPAFQAASVALGALRTKLEQTWAASQARQLSEEDRRRAAALADTVDERTRPARFRDDAASLGAFALRLELLWDAGQHCQRAEEMWHYLDRVDWRPSHPPKNAIGSAHANAVTLAVKHGLARPGVTIESMPDGVVRADTFRFRDALTFTAGYTAETWDRSSAGDTMLRSYRECHGPTATLERFPEIREKLGSQLADRPDASTYPTVTAADYLEVAELSLRVQTGGMTPEIERRLSALVDRHAGDANGTFWTTSHVGAIVRLGEEHRFAHVARLGLTDATLEGALRAVVAKDPRVIDLSNPYCARAAEAAKPQAEWFLGRFDEAAPDRKAQERTQFGLALGPLKELGCIKGVPGRIRDVEGAYALIRGSLPHVKGDAHCASGVTTIETTVTDDNLGYARKMPEQGPLYAVTALSTWYATLIWSRCLDP